MPDTSPQPRSPRLHILIAEDNPVNQAVAAAILEKQGHRLSLAANGREAVALFERDRPDLILMDVQMPELDGVGATREIRAAEKSGGRSVPIIAMTAEAMSADLARSLLPGMDAYISKPLSKEGLLDTIESLVKKPDVATADLVKTVDLPTFNRSELLKNLDGDTDLFNQVTQVFAQNTPGHLEQIRRAIKDRDGAALERAVHVLLSSLGVFGAARAKEIAMSLQTAGQLLNFEDAEDALR